LKMSCRNSREDKIDDLRSVLDGRLELIQDSFENAHLEYLERTDKRVSDFKHYTRVRERERERPICVFFMFVCVFKHIVSSQLYFFFFFFCE
jgi:hypothetical protein